MDLCNPLFPGMSPYSKRDIWLFIVAVFIPPIPVLYKRGCGPDALINAGLCLLGGLPGIVHAWFIIHKHSDYFEDLKYDEVHEAILDDGRRVLVTYSSTSDDESN